MSSEIVMLTSSCWHSVYRSPKVEEVGDDVYVEVGASVRVGTGVGDGVWVGTNELLSSSEQ